jgi:hypothetical protein
MLDVPTKMYLTANCQLITALVILVLTIWISKQELDGNNYLSTRILLDFREY